MSTRCRKYINTARGFTLTEILIALGIGAAVALVLAVVTAQGLKHMRNTRSAGRLQANAVYLSNAFTYWIKQGLVLDVPDATTLNVVVQTATSTRTVVLKKNATRVTLDGAPITSDDIQVTALSFRHLQKSVRIAFTLKTPSAQLFSATTTVAQRNAF